MGFFIGTLLCDLTNLLLSLGISVAKPDQDFSGFIDAAFRNQPPWGGRKKITPM